MARTKININDVPYNQRREFWAKARINGVWKNSFSPIGCFATITRRYGDQKISLIGNIDINLYPGKTIMCRIRQKEDPICGYETYEVIEIIEYITSKRKAKKVLCAEPYNLTEGEAIDLYEDLGDELLYDLFAKRLNIDTLPISEKSKENLKLIVQAQSKSMILQKRFPILSTRKVNDHNLCDYLVAAYEDPLKLLMENPYRFLEDGNLIRTYTFAVAEKIAISAKVSKTHPARVETLFKQAFKKLLYSLSGDNCIKCDETFKRNFIEAVYELSAKESFDYALPKNFIDQHLGDYIYDFDIVNESPTMDDNKPNDYLTMQFFKHEKYGYLALNSDVNYELNIKDYFDTLNEEPPLFKDSISYIKRMIAEFEEIEGLKLSDEQKNAVINALTHRVSIITGGPGRGKTAITKAILYCYKHAPSLQFSKSLNMMNATAFTGKATQRIKESIQNSLAILGIDEQRDIKINTMGIYTFTQAPTSTITGLVIIDEMSMVSSQTLSFFLNKIKENGNRVQIVLVGDVDQLPSIGRGQVFKDLIDSNNFCISPLTINMRLGNLDAMERLAVLNNHQCILANMPESIVELPNQFEWQLQGEPEDKVFNQIVDDYCNYVNGSHGFDKIPISDICILAPMKSVTDSFSTIKLNIAIQNRLNPLGLETTILYGSGVNFTTKLRVGDRVILTKNKHGLGCYNGDIGTIIGYKANEITVKFDTQEKPIMLDRTDALDLELAYALTIHKSQGSEYKIVLLAISKGASAPWSIEKKFLSKNLIYTGVTRAKDVVLLYGDKENFNKGLPVDAKKRTTLLGLFYKNEN